MFGWFVLVLAALVQVGSDVMAVMVVMIWLVLVHPDPVGLAGSDSRFVLV